MEDEHERRRDIRHRYRTLISETQKNQLELIQPANTGLNEALEVANRLFVEVKEVKGTREAAMDSSFLVIASSLGKQRAQKLHTDLVKFDPNEFVEKLTTYMSGRRFENDTQSQNRNGRRISRQAWQNLGNEARLLFKKAPAFHSLLGSFGYEQPKRTVSRQRAKKDDEVTAKPKQLTSVVQSHQEVTTEEVGKIMAILRQYTRYNEASDSSEIEPVRLLDFVVNPHSYGQTIENIFYVSFLVKDGHAKIELDGDDLPVILPCEPYKEGQTNTVVEKKQFMFSLTMEKWKEAIKVFDIVDPLIPTRDE